MTLLDHFLLGVLAVCVIIAIVIVWRKEPIQHSMSCYTGAAGFLILGAYILVSGGQVSHLAEQLRLVRGEVGNLQSQNTLLVAKNEFLTKLSTFGFGTAEGILADIQLSKEELNKVYMVTGEARLTGPIVKHIKATDNQLLAAYTKAGHLKEVFEKALIYEDKQIPSKPSK